MAYPKTSILQFPLENYKVNSYRFKHKATYNGVYWGIHLGEDVNVKAGTKVFSTGRGRVVYSALHKGSKEKPNWGNIVIIGHKHFKSGKTFYTLYAHLGKRSVKAGDKVEAGKIIGAVGKKSTPQNGWWKDEHLHFAIYQGPWGGKVLPGYFKKGDNRTELRYWKKPSLFIKSY